MKLLFAFLAVFAVVLLSGVEAEDSPQISTLDEPAIADHEDREPRITCDLLSFGKFNHALCAAHCLVKGYRGGYCDDHGVCNCRN